MNEVDGTRDPIRVVAVDDDASYAQMLVIAFATTPDIRVVATASSAEEGLRRVVEHHPDIVVLDLGMPGGGLAAADTIRRQAPEVKIVMLTGSGTEQDAREALRRGVDGYLLKESVLAALEAGIRCVHAGVVVLAPLALRAVLTEPVEQSPLSAYEHRLLELLGQGVGNKEIGQTLSVSQSKLRRDVGELTKKLGVGNAVQAVVRTVRKGWIQLH